MQSQSSRGGGGIAMEDKKLWKEFRKIFVVVVDGDIDKPKHAA
jgi:hypothetical protein